MRKILAGFMATSMIVAMASATTFAASTAAQMTFTAGVDATWGGVTDFNGQTMHTMAAGDTVTKSAAAWTLQVEYTEATVTLPNAGGVSFKIPIKKAPYSYGGNTITDPANGVNDYAEYDLSAALPTAVDVIDAIDGSTFSLNVNGVSYTGAAKTNASGNLVLEFDQKGAVDTTGATITITGYKLSTKLPHITIKDSVPAVVADYDDVADATTWNAATAAFTRPTLTLNSQVNGTGTAYAEEEPGGAFKTQGLHVNDVVWCDGNGNPMVFTEKLSAVDEDQNTEGGVQSNKTLYFLIRDDKDCQIDKLEDDTFWKLKITKGDNGKYIKAVTDVTKNFKDGLYPLNGKSIFSGTVGRHRYIKVELNEIYTDDEYKITLDMRLSAKSKAVNAGVKIGATTVTDDSEIKVKDFYFYMKNLVKEADNDWKVGINGLMLNPLTNDWNDVTWFDEDGDVAHMKFFADSDVSKFYSKLSTKWEHADYASYFNDQDAFVFNFVGSPKLSATSRADLEIYNPFLDEDGNTTIDPSSAVIYQVIDGDLFDVTSSFEYKEGENGDMAYVTRTRFLGTYIICEKAVEEAVGDSSDVPEDLIPEETNPSEVTPDNNNGGKAPANTGKYL